MRFRLALIKISTHDYASEVKKRFPRLEAMSWSRAMANTKHRRSAIRMNRPTFTRESLFHPG
jgi:hypothetical protein